jgi:hypothetical protein
MFVRSVVALSVLALAFAAGCSAKSKDTSSTDGSLGTNEDALSADNNDSQDAEDSAEDGIENGLSGASASDPGTPADGTTADAIDAKIKTNPGLYFQPAGCIVSTREAPGVWTHVFTNCTGPKGRITYNGTVKSTWTVSANQLEVKHEATNFEAKGPRVTVTFSGSRDVTYTRSGTVITKHRVGSWSGTITKNADPSKSAPWSHTADFTSTWDSASKCYTRDGEADNSIGGRTFGRKVTGFKVCGGIFACPEGGELELDRKDGSVKITVTFDGGQDVTITGPRGNSINVKLICDAS